ncbi:MAG TPA: NHL repeat-containing protein [Gemmataceae bacterium]|jgi:sugar lactone lactonase YvrE
MKRLALVLAVVIGWSAPPAAAQPPLYVSNSGPDNTGFGHVKKVLPDGSSTDYATVAFPVGLAAVTSGVNAGTLYVSDYGSNSILKVATNGTVSTYRSGFNTPTGIVLDASGNLYVADQGNNRVVRIPAGGGTPTVWATGTTDFAPVGLALDRTGSNLYISDTNDQAVYRVGTSAPAGALPAPFAAVSFPTGLAVGTDGTLYVSSFTTNTIRTIPAGGGPQGTFASGIMSPYGLAFDPSGTNLFATAFGSGDVFQIPVSTGVPAVYAGGFDGPYFLAFPVPEPAGVLLACGGAAAVAAGWRRLRRRTSPSAA